MPVLVKEWDFRVLNRHQPYLQKELHAAVVGTGVFGRHHAAKYAGLAGVKLAAIADSDSETRRLAASQFGLIPAADWRDLLGKVDLVSVCTPAGTHAEIVREFLSSGAHVLVEKPIATTLDEAEELIVLAAARNLVLTVGHQERFVFAKSGLLDGEEAPLAVECDRSGPWTGRGADVSVVLDLMIHDLDLVHRLLPGAAIDVRARGRLVHSAHLDEVSASLLFENGATAHLFASRASDTRTRSLRAIYADGVIEIDFMARRVTNTTGRRLNPLDLVSAFVKAVKGESAALVRPEEAREALRTALMIEEAAEAAFEVFPSSRPALRATA
jgi:predicted dehydrogenase